MARFHIYHAPLSIEHEGEVFTITAADLAATAAAYDPEVHEAPVTLDHKDHGPALGWVTRLEAIEGDLFAHVHALPELIDLVESGRYRKVSAAFSKPGWARNPHPGIWSLYHVALLGAGIPRVRGLAPIDLQSSPSPDGISPPFRRWLRELERVGMAARAGRSEPPPPIPEDYIPTPAEREALASMAEWVMAGAP
ncbi:hypothetical protein [Thiocystis violacea]|uniref:hypothetical protein n=1 Tax=Thiocystis violacea TaxID=13725 RepID=UPI001907FDC7|nr:hypothetical protein [Thiocystis violacea]MBK1716675.1 hypothetical protein [Thiocystis violacea]